MQDVLTREVRDLGADARSILETMLGRKLAEEEQVTVMAFAPADIERSTASFTAFDGTAMILRSMGWPQSFAVG